MSQPILSKESHFSLVTYILNAPISPNRLFSAPVYETKEMKQFLKNLFCMPPTMPVIVDHQVNGGEKKRVINRMVVEVWVARAVLASISAAVYAIFKK
jgi:hypothetical protein